MHTWLTPRSFAISSCAGSARFLVTNDPLEVSPFARRDDVAVPIRPITERHWLFPASSARHLNSAPCGDTCLTARRDAGFILSHSNDMNDLVPVSMPAAVLSVCSKSKVKQPTAFLLARACQRLWLYGM